MQAHEAFYRQFLCEFLSSHENKDDLLSSTCTKMFECNKACRDQDSAIPLQDILQSQHPKLITDFQTWLCNLADRRILCSVMLFPIFHSFFQSEVECGT